MIWVSSGVFTSAVIPSSVWKQKVNNRREEVKGTHVEDTTNLVEIQHPGGDGLPVVLRMEKPKDCISFTAFDDIPLDLGHGPAIKSLVRK